MTSRKSKAIALSTLLCSIIMQAVTFSNSSNVYYENGFAIGLSNLSKNYDVAFKMVFVLLPVVFILLFFSGTTQEITQDYGKLLIIRNYSKTKLILKRLFKNSVMLSIIVLLQCAVFLFINSSLIQVENGMLKSLVMYFIILNSMIMLQSLLELYIAAQSASVILLVYSFASYYIVQITEENVILKILLFPCLMFGMQNGAVNCENIYYIYLTTGVLMNFFLIMLCIRKFKRTDIF